MRAEYLRHEYTWSNHCISGNRLGWGVTASSVPEEKEHLREIEKLAQAAIIDRTGAVAVEELSYSPRCGFVKMISLPCESGEDNRKNKRVSLFEPRGENAANPACYLAPAREHLWEEQRGLLPPAAIEMLSEDTKKILEEMGMIHRLPEFMRAVFWCLFRSSEGLNFVAPSWREEEFSKKASRLMFTVHQFLPASLRKKAGYVSFAREALTSVSFYFSRKPCGANCFFLSEEQTDKREWEELDAYFFTGFAGAFREQNQIYTEFMEKAEKLLADGGSDSSALRKLEWIFYDISRKNKGKALPFSCLAEHFPQLLYWTARDGGMMEVSGDILQEIHRHRFTEKDWKFYVESLLSGMTGRSKELVLCELKWLAGSLYEEDKAQFARLLADIREKNRGVYTSLLCGGYPDGQDAYGKELFERNAGTMEKLCAYVTDFKESDLPPDFKDHILRTGIGLLNEKIFDRKRYGLFDRMAVHLKREGQWAEILKDFVGQLEEHAQALDGRQLETACYVEELLCRYRPEQTAMPLREEKRRRTRKKKTEDSGDDSEEDSDMGRRYKGGAPGERSREIRAAQEAEVEVVRDEEREEALVPFLLTGFPQGFLTGCIMYLSRYSLMIGHWKIALGMAGMWILLMLNYECVLLQKKDVHPLWKTMGLCLLEGWLIEVTAWFFRSQKIRLYYFIALGIFTLLIQVINLVRIKRRQEREQE